MSRKYKEHNPTERELIENCEVEKLYSNEFISGKFFYVVYEDDENVHLQYAPRTKLEVSYIDDKKDINGLKIIKLVNNKETQRLHLSNFDFARLKEFLRFIDGINLDSITERKIQIVEGAELDADNIELIKQLLSKKGGEDLIVTLINEGMISSKDIVNTAFRKRGLEIFKKMLDDSDAWKAYARENDLSELSEEKVWQYFFKKNEWIFGYGLDYRYQEILQPEVSLSDSDLDGSETRYGDFLIGDNNFTSFIELKKPSTPLFSSSKNRSGSWRLSTDFIDSVSQILEQKATGEIKLSELQYIKGEPMQQKAYDSNVILIVGSWSEVDGISTKERDIKKKTFELFRRNNRNIEILTYDELYERAKFITADKLINDSRAEPENDYAQEVVDKDDLPF